MDAIGRGYTYPGGDHSRPFATLCGQAEGVPTLGLKPLWPTPTASLTNDAESPESFERRHEQLKKLGVNGNGAGTPLTMAVKMWATPTSRDWKDGTAVDFKETLVGSPPLGRQAPRSMTSGLGSSPSDPTSLPRLRLNPEFVEWLMGLPVGWSLPVRDSGIASRD